MIAGVVLAAGRSSRLGRPKQLLPLHGEPLIRHTVRRALASSLDEIIVVLGHQADDVSAALAGLPARIVLNPDAAHGQSTSVIAGLRALGAGQEHACQRPEVGAMPASPHADAVVFLLGDQPGIETAVIDALIAAWRETRAPVVAPRYHDGIGNPILFDRSVFSELVTLRGDTGARPIVQAHRAAGDLLLAPVDAFVPRDVDTDEDYAALIASFPKEIPSRPAAPLSHREG